MWLKRLVAFFMIITCLAMSGIVVAGVFSSPKQPIAIAPTMMGDQSSSAPTPTVVLKADPETIAAGQAAALDWQTNDATKGCKASDDWTGDKTPNGAESSGRLSSSRNYTFTLTCSNESGDTTASAVVTVGNAAPPAKRNTSTSSSTQSSGPSYCGGRTPCYSAKEVAAHGSAGNCWGYNLDRAIDISHYDLGYHVAKSGISSIEIGQVCGKDLRPGIDGSLAAQGKSYVHTAATKSNNDSSVFPYFVGYFDPTKP